MFDGKNIKVGISKHPKKRVKQLNTGNSNNLILLGYFKGGLREERYIHNNFHCKRGEWMYPTDELIDYLNERLEDRFIINDNGHVRSCLKLNKK